MTIDLDGRVCAEDVGARMQRVNCLRFFECESLHIDGGRFGGTARFVDVGRDDVKGETGLREKLAASRRGGGESQPHQARASPEMKASITCASRGWIVMASSATLAASMQSIWRQPWSVMSVRPAFDHGFQTTVVLEFALVTVMRRCSTGSSTTTGRSEEHTSELQSHSDLVCRLLLEQKRRAELVPIRSAGQHFRVIWRRLPAEP